MRFRKIYRDLIPESIRRPVYTGRRILTNRKVREWHLNSAYWRSAFKIRSFHNKHDGDRCFIIGNGPSLNKTDLSLLKDEYTFGLNRIYLLFPKLGFHTSYFVSINRLVIEQFNKDIEELPMPKFINWHAREHISQKQDLYFIRDPYDGSMGFSHNPGKRIWEGATVTYVAMQLAYYMGFREVFLIGVDHSFTTKGEPNKEVTSQGGDPNHFDPSYFGKGYRWQLPDLDFSEKAYRIAKTYFETDGRKIVDATIGGKLEVFEKADYSSLFE
jgi:hypothetical protein